MNQTIDVSKLTPDQIQQIQAIIASFEVKNSLNNLANGEVNNKDMDIIDYLTENPVKVHGFLTRQEIYESVIETNVA